MEDPEKKTIGRRVIDELRKLSPSELARRFNEFTDEQKERAAAAARADPHLIELWNENGWLDADGLPDLDNPHVRLTWTMAAPHITKALCEGNRAPLIEALPDEQRDECLELYLNYVSPDGSKYCDIEHRRFIRDGIKWYRNEKKNKK